MDDETRKIIMERLSLKGGGRIYCKHDRNKPCAECLSHVSGDLTGIRGNLSDISGDLTGISGERGGDKGSVEGQGAIA
jgi:hypothetical protein